jgi:hypothetical protein
VFAHQCPAPYLPTHSASVVHSLASTHEFGTRSPQNGLPPTVVKQRQFVLHSGVLRFVQKSCPAWQVLANGTAVVAVVVVVDVVVDVVEVVVEVVGGTVVVVVEVVDVVEVVVDVVGRTVVEVVVVGDGWQRRRPCAFFGRQTPEQQLALSRQVAPPSRQVAPAAVSRIPTRPMTPAMSPRSRRRREPDAANERVRASKRDPSIRNPSIPAATVIPSRQPTRRHAKSHRSMPETWSL